MDTFRTSKERVITMLPKSFVILAICLQSSLFLVHSSENPNTPEPITGCESSKNNSNWLLKDFECSPNKTQASLLANISRQDAKHGQVSLLTNIAMQDVEKFQLAWTLNYGKHVRGAQIAWNINIANKVEGWQLGGINIADTVKGAQLGSINIANHLEGVGIGFLTLTNNGLLHLDISAEESGMEKLSFASGKTFFTSYSLGYSLENDTHPYSFGMGFGYNKAFAKTYLEAELQVALVLDRYTKLSNIDKHKDDDKDSDWRYNHLMQAKLRIGHELFHNLGIFGGISYNALATHEQDRLIGSATETFTTHSKDFYGWPGLEIGIRLGR
jgi:hypothetical protein